MLKIQKNKLVKSIVDPALEKVGFPEMVYCKADKGNFWSSELRHDDLIKGICVQDVYGTLRLVARTNAYRRMPVFARQDKEGEFAENGNVDWRYSDKEEFRNILISFTDIIEKYTLKELEKISVPETEIYPTKAEQLYLFENHEEITNKCLEEWGLKDKDIDTILSYLDHLIEMNRKKKFNDVRGLLLQIASVYGDTAIRNYGGSWIWNKTYNNAIVEHKDLVRRSSVPFNTMIFHWEKADGCVMFFDFINNSNFPHEIRV